MPDKRYNARYYSADDLPPVEPTPTGDGTNPHYRLDPLTNTVIRDGDDDLQSMIQAAESSCRIEDVLRRYRQSGDPAIFQQRKAMFGDLRIEEGSYEQALVLGTQLHQIYDGLDEKTRAEVGSFESFLVMMAQGQPVEQSTAGVKESPAKEEKDDA